ncbi:MAG: Serine/threonine protein kinase [Limisphaerales bacterium]|nr:MAG: Serine/threonine protein kinase [Limisphaerales bacterium]KAG0507907.1 MAG: Serine/threonine protein kinase [Limisphaerales bacterium]TXT50004.1 MAG: Serine/threonine protein kinase [Limisphaerales bacterium]
MSNPSEARCPRCAAPLPPNAPEGLCPRCLGALNLATETVPTGADAPGASPQPPLTPAELAPHFPQLEILECLGRGGMGVVYKARQKTLNRVVALKLLAPERVTDAGFAERFTREAQALARLNHPNIVTIHDFGCTRAGAQPETGFYFLLMEFVDGVNLRQAMKAGRFTPEQALAIVPPVCEALQYAHEQGIVHRDIKPENLLLDKAGRIKIADFGIAKMLETGGAELPLGHSTEAAQQRGPAGQESLAAGTPQYMAPEQRTAPQRTDHRADIYSLGVVLYELLTGELPGAKLQPPSRKVQIDVRLDEIVLRALETKPELRYATAAEFRTQVENITDSTASSGHARPSEPAWFKPVGLLYVLAGLLGWLPTVASLGTHVVTHHGAVMLSATGLALLTRHRWWRWLAIGTNTLAIANYLFGHAVVLGLASLDRIPSGSPWPNDMGGVAREMARHAPDNLLILAGFGCGIWLLFRPDARAAFASQCFTHREHNVIVGLAVAALVGGLLPFVWPYLAFNPYAHLVKAGGVFGLAAWCLLRGGTAAAPLRLSPVWGISLRVLVAVVAIGLALLVGFLVLAGLYRSREATMRAALAALAAKQRASSTTANPQSATPAPGLAFGPVIERVITFNETGPAGLMFVNLAKAELMPPPFPLPVNSPDPVIFQRSARIEEWIAAAGADLALHLTDHNWGFTPLGTRLNYQKDEPDPATFLERITLKEAQAILTGAAGRTNYLTSMGGRVSGYPGTASFVFKTRQGAIGLLHMAGFADGFTENPRGVRLRCRLAQTNAPAALVASATASPVTSSIAASDNSPAAIAAAQQRGIAAATRDIQAGIFRILRYGLLVKTDGTETDEETGFRIQWVAGSILSNQFRAEADAYNFAMRDRYWKHEHWQRKAASESQLVLDAVPRAAWGVEGPKPALLRWEFKCLIPSEHLAQILFVRRSNGMPTVVEGMSSYYKVGKAPVVTDFSVSYETNDAKKYPDQASQWNVNFGRGSTTSQLLPLEPVYRRLESAARTSLRPGHQLTIPLAESAGSERTDRKGQSGVELVILLEPLRSPAVRSVPTETDFGTHIGASGLAVPLAEVNAKLSSQSGNSTAPTAQEPQGPHRVAASATNATAMDFRVLKVETSPGLRDIRVHFQCAAPAGFGFEVCQDVTRGPYGEAPKSKDAFWLRTKWVGLNDPPVLVWTLPEDFTPEEVQAGAKQVEAHLRTMRDALRMLPTEAVSSFGKVRHREGWLYELVLRVKRARDHSPVQAADAWVVEGTVRDGEGKPVPEADIHVSCGAGSLFVTGKGKTGADGTYRVGFGPGISMAAGDRRGAMQAAIVHVGKAGFEEKELGNGGNLQMAWELTPQQLAGGWQPGPQKTFLPGKPLRVDFVLLPTATVRGTLLTPDGKPLPNREIVLVGDRLRPGSSIYASAKTDACGRFTFKDVSTQHAWSFSIERTPHHRKRTAPDRFAEARVYEVTLIADGDDLRRGDVSAKPKAGAGANLPAATRVATTEGKYDLAGGVTLVITAKLPPRGKGPKHFDGRLDWPKSATNPKAESFDVALSEGAPFAVGWRADGQVLWVACGGGDGTDNSIRYIRKLTIAGPGDVGEQSWNAREKGDFGGLPAELRRVFDAFIAPQATTNQATGVEDEFIRVAQQRLQQVRLQSDAGRAGLLDVIEAEGALAVAESRSDALKQAEARLLTASKVLAVVDKLRLAGRADVETVLQAKQRKLAAELEVQRLRAGASVPPSGGPPTTKRREF